MFELVKKFDLKSMLSTRRDCSVEVKYKKGKVKKVIILDKNSVHQFKYTYHYNDNEYLTKRVTYSNDEITKIEKFEYNEKWNCIHYVDIAVEFDIENHFYARYDDQNREIYHKLNDSEIYSFYSDDRRCYKRDHYSKGIKVKEVLDPFNKFSRDELEKLNNSTDYNYKPWDIVLVEGEEDPLVIERIYSKGGQITAVNLAKINYLDAIKNNHHYVTKGIVDVSKIKRKLGQVKFTISIEGKDSNE